MVVGSGEHDKKVVLGIAVKFADDLAFYDCAFGLFVLGPNIKVIPKYYKNSNNSCTGKSLSGALIFASIWCHNMMTNFSLNYKFNTWKFQAQNMGRTCCVQKLFLTFRTISVHNMFSQCFTKRRASDKDLPVSGWIHKVG